MSRTRRAALSALFWAAMTMLLFVVLICVLALIYIAFGPPSEPIQFAFRVAFLIVLLAYFVDAFWRHRRRRRLVADFTALTLKRRALIEGGWKYQTKSDTWVSRGYPGQRFGMEAAYRQLKADHQTELVLLERRDPRETGLS